MKGWLSLVAALIFFAASALNFFNAGFNSANGTSGVLVHIGLSIVWLSLGCFWLMQAHALLPNAGLNRPGSRSEAEAGGSELKPLLGEDGEK